MIFLWGYDFSFYITQLSGYKALNDTPNEDGWPELREAQAMATQVLDRCGMACIIDLGEAEDVHPVRKREVGERLARLALSNDYGRKLVSTGPRYESHQIVGSTIRVRFSDVAGGLRVIPSGDFAGDRYGIRNERVEKAESGVLSGFQIAGPDRVWHWAEARIEGDGVVVWSEKVPHPLAIRYAWSANPVCNLFNSEGLPAWPFRTDDWPGLTYGK